MKRPTYWKTAGLVLALALAGAACGDDDDTAGGGDDGGTTPVKTTSNSGSKGDGGTTDAGTDGGTMASTGSADECKVVVKDKDCDESQRPFVVVHGTYGSATEISNIALLFGSNGYCQDRFVAVEYNSLGGNPEAQLEQLIDDIREKTGFDQVDLAGHSQGTAHACTYLSDPDRRAKVAHYINISGGCDGYGIPTLSLSSQNDIGGSPHHASGDNVTQVTFEHQDHVALAGSKDSFVAIWKYLHDDEDPKYTDVQCGADPITIDGKSVTFGDNEPLANGKIEVFEIDKVPGPRERGKPVMTIESDENGHFNAQLKRGVQYEFRGLDPDGNLLGYTYVAPFKRSNYIMRFIAESGNPTIRAASTDNVVRSDDQVGMVARYIAGAFRADWGNSLKIDGKEILTDENAGMNASIVGLFMYDGNEDGKTELGATAPMGSFLMGTDVFMDASEPRFMKLEWTNEEGSTVTLKIPNWPSSESLISVNLPY